MTKNRVLLLLSIVLVILISMVSYAGLSIVGFYVKETANWRAQSMGQDMADLFVLVPTLFISAIAAYRGSEKAALVWGGAILYTIYTFTIYCFDVHFNPLFLMYCITLGTSFYALLYFLYLKTGTIKSLAIEYPIARLTGIYFIVIAILFYFLWLSEVVPFSISNTTPPSLAEVGLVTNPVHVIDLAIFLPGLLLTGILLLRKHSLGYFLAPMLLAFFILMDITIGWLIVLMKQRGLEGSLAVATAMGVLAVISLALLTRYLNCVRGC